MGNALQTAAAWLARKTKTHVSRAVVYQRGSLSVTVQAVLGNTLLRLSDDAGGVRMEWTDRDFLISSADLILAGEVTLPKRGDRIVDGEQTYEVAASGGEPAWRFSDAHRTILRIHAKEIR